MTRRQASRLLGLIPLGLFVLGGLLSLEKGDPLVGIALLCLAVAVPIIGFVLFSPAKRRQAFRLRHHLCLTCGYDLRAHKPGDRCPECGKTVPNPSE
jgi:hypothetical protein